jgi:uncharacterized protein YndB with AHSA1/START domain
MSGLFSHSSVSDEGSAELPDLQTDVSVPATTLHAWAGLTEHLHLWWPAGELSRWGADSFFDLEDNALVETSAEDDENVWGEVIGGEPGQYLELRWRHLGSPSTTLIRFDVSGDGAAGAMSTPALEVSSQAGAVSTLTLTHRGWTAADPPELYAFYRDFWPEALGRYLRFMGGS